MIGDPDTRYIVLMQMNHAELVVVTDFGINLLVLFLNMPDLILSMFSFCSYSNLSSRSKALGFAAGWNMSTCRKLETALSNPSSTDI